MVAILAWPAGPASRCRTHPMGHNRGQLPPVRCQPLRSCRAGPGGRPQ